jgi:hypothetical protein
MHASGPTPYILLNIFTRDFFLVTKLLLDIILVIMKHYSEADLYDALVAIADGMALREASRTWYILRSIL